MNIIRLKLQVVGFMHLNKIFSKQVSSNAVTRSQKKIVCWTHIIYKNFSKKFDQPWKVLTINFVLYVWKKKIEKNFKGDQNHFHGDLLFTCLRSNVDCAGKIHTWIKVQKKCIRQSVNIYFYYYELYILGQGYLNKPVMLFILSLLLLNSVFIIE